MKTIISCIGFDTSRIYKSIMRYGIDSGDRVVLIRVESDDTRNESAENEVRNMLNELNPDVDLDFYEFDPLSFDENVDRISEIIESAEGELMIDMGGGDRSLFVPFVLSVATTSRQPEKVHVFSDSRREHEAVDFPHFDLQLNQTDEEILKKLYEEGEMDNSNLSDLTGIPESTVSQAVKRLKERGYVEVSQEGKRRLVEIRNAGVLGLRNAGIHGSL